VRVLAILFCLVSVAAAADGEPRVAIEVDTPSRTCFEMERVSITLRLSLDLADFEARSVTLFNRPMDLQLKVRAPWMEALPGAVALPSEPSPPGADTLSLVLNDRVVPMRRVGEQDGLVTLALTRRFRPERAGVLAITAPVVTFAYATEFEDDFVTGRRPVDRKDARVTGEPLRISVLPVPEAGRPERFPGAVGRFTAAAALAPTAVAVGDALKLTLRIEGEGNLTRFDTPRLPDLPGFHVYGGIDDRASPVRTIVYDLVCTGAATELPAIDVPYFDPAPPGRWAAASTAAIPVAVTGGAAPVAPDPEAEPEAPEGPGALVWGLAALLVVGGVVIVVWRVVRGRPDAPEPTPAEVFRERVAGPDADLEAALAAYLAEHLGCPTAAVISPDLAERLVAAGVPEDLAARTAALVAGLVAERYGGEGDGGGTAEARELVRELDAALADRSPDEV
jgi:hypothetical protein